MTCICAVVERGRMWMGADSAVLDEAGVRMSLMEPKMWRTGEFLIGCAGASRAAQLIRYGLAPIVPPEADLTAYMVSTFVEDVRKRLLAGGHIKTHRGQEESELVMLIAAQGRLYGLGEDFSIIESSEAFDAIGTGSEVAWGVLAVKRGMAPRQRITLALEKAAARYSTVGPPFSILEL